MKKLINIIMITISFAWIHSSNSQPIYLPDFEGEWEGYWENLTYGSTDSIFATMTVEKDSEKVHVIITTTGIFGDPQTSVFEYEESYTDSLDSLLVLAPEPLQGSFICKNGKITGTIIENSLRVTVTLTGEYNSSSISIDYSISGIFEAIGIVKMKKKTATSIDRLVSKNNLPAEFMLRQNFPNPFNPKTVISYQLTNFNNVNLTVFNINGQLIRTLVQSEQPAGDYSVIWNGKDNNNQTVSSGIYIYQLRVGNKIQKNRMLLMK